MTKFKGNGKRWKPWWTPPLVVKSSETSPWARTRLRRLGHKLNKWSKFPWHTLHCKTASKNSTIYRVKLRFQVNKDKSWVYETCVYVLTFVEIKLEGNSVSSDFLPLLTFSDFSCLGIGTGLKFMVVGSRLRVPGPNGSRTWPLYCALASSRPWKSRMTWGFSSSLETT